MRVTRQWGLIVAALRGIVLLLQAALVGGCLIKSSLSVNTATSPVPTSTAYTGSLPSRLTDGKGVEMALVPEGEFLMGSTDADKDAAIDEKPQHKVYLDTFYIDLNEVTNAMYRTCVNAGDCTQPGSKSSNTHSDYYENPHFDDYPVIYVDWNQAVAFCEWRGARLPTEAEWEKAARGTDGRIYPWGNYIDCSRANYSRCKVSTTKVGSYSSGASPYGLLNMAGNVWEWVQDRYLDKFYQSSPSENPVGSSSGVDRVVRGGSWNMDRGQLRGARRSSLAPSTQSIYQGFRCARTP